MISFSKQLPIAQIELRPELWSRADQQLDQTILEDYTVRLSERGALKESHDQAKRELYLASPVTVVAANESEGPFLLVNGRYRLGAASNLNATHIEAKVIIPEDGETVEDRAVLEAARANSEHGKSRTNADKRRAVIMLLDHPRWSSKSSNWIAIELGVSNSFVGRVRDKHCPEQTSVEGPDGKCYPAKAAKKKSPEPETPLGIVSDDAAVCRPQTDGEGDDDGGDELSELESDDIDSDMEFELNEMLEQELSDAIDYEAELEALLSRLSRCDGCLEQLYLQPNYPESQTLTAQHQIKDLASTLRELKAMLAANEELATVE